MRHSPYVVSADIKRLLEQWAGVSGYVVPDAEFFHELRNEFQAHMHGIFPEFHFVHEEELVEGLDHLIAEGGLPTISLDRVYVESDLHLDIARLVDKDGNDHGIGSRVGYPSLSDQLKHIHESGVKEVALVDDVLFTGDVLERIVEMLAHIGVTVQVAHVGIGILGGVKQVTVPVQCVRQYDDVIDEVCERDFYPGVPLSGRVIAGDEGFGAPYIRPFGNPEAWASIPAEHVESFSRFCLLQTISLFDEIGRRSGRSVHWEDAPRKIVGLNPNGHTFADALRGLFRA